MEDLFVRPRPQPPSSSTDADASDSANRGAKNLSFSFHVGLYKTGGDSVDEVYHTVGGHRRRGLIIDPGAANSLVGTETLRDLVDHCDQSSVIKTSMQWQEKQAEVTGISGQSDPILGQVTMPLPMFEELREATYTWFQNNDGLLILPTDKEMKTFSLYRLLLTDSKHYLLPVDGKMHLENEEHRKAATFLSNVQEQSAKNGRTRSTVSGTLMERAQDGSGVNFMNWKARAPLHRGRHGPGTRGLLDGGLR